MVPRGFGLSPGATSQPPMDAGEKSVVRARPGLHHRSVQRGRRGDDRHRGPSSLAAAAVTVAVVIDIMTRPHAAPITATPQLEGGVQVWEGAIIITYPIENNITSFIPWRMHGPPCMPRTRRSD